MKHKRNIAERPRTGVYAYALPRTGTGVSFFITAALLSLAFGALLAEAAPARTASSPFSYTWSQPGTLEETGSMGDSSSPYFWLNSGARLVIENGIGRTVHGALAPDDPWLARYAKSSSADTEAGKYPQNLFRLLTRSTWHSPVQEIRFRIDRINLTESPNRDGHNGVLLMSNYQDGANLYYAGIRTDGKAVIKKKYRGVYYTLATKSGVFPGTYHRYAAPNLIPSERWMRVKTEVVPQKNGTVRITLWLDRGNGTYEALLTATDSKTFGGGVLTEGYVGVRTDFMDVSFDDYLLVKR